MFCGHEWKDEERRLHKNDRCRKEIKEESMSLDDMELASLDSADFLDPELLSEEYEPEPHLVIVMERRRIDRDEIKARKQKIWRRSRFDPWF